MNKCWECGSEIKEDNLEFEGQVFCDYDCADEWAQERVKNWNVKKKEALGDLAKLEPTTDRLTPAQAKAIVILLRFVPSIVRKEIQRVIG